MFGFVPDVNCFHVHVTYDTSLIFQYIEVHLGLDYQDEKSYYWRVLNLLKEL